jgi:hypothetical protein
MGWPITIDVDSTSRVVYLGEGDNSIMAIDMTTGDRVVINQ